MHNVSKFFIFPKLFSQIFQKIYVYTCVGGFTMNEDSKTIQAIVNIIREAIYFYLLNGIIIICEHALIAQLDRASPS